MIILAQWQQKDGQVQMTEAPNKVYEEGNKTIKSVIRLMTEAHDCYDDPVKFSYMLCCGFSS